MEPARLNWVCGEDDFLLRIGELEALDDLTEAGVLDLRYRLSLGSQRGCLGYSPVKIRELIACIRLGLIGAGMDRSKAEVKAKNAFIDGDIAELNILAFTIISNSLVAKEHDPVGEVEAGETTSASASPASTETQPPSE